MLSVKRARLLLRLHEDDISDDELEEYIEYFTLTTLGRLGKAAQRDNTVHENPLFQEAIMAAIACRLSLTDLDIIHSPSAYQVGDTSEEYKNTSFGNYGKIPSWCDIYDNILASLSSEYSDIENLQVFRRKGMSVRRKWYRDLY